MNDNFQIFIYADDGFDEPTSPVTFSAIYSASAAMLTDRHLTGERDPIFNTSIYQYSADIPAFQLTGGTRYWLEIYNNISSPDYYWLWSQDANVLNRKGFYADLRYDPNWLDVGETFSPAKTFQLFGIVPEPSTLVLLVLGSIGLLARRR